MTTPNLHLSLQQQSAAYLERQRHFGRAQKLRFFGVPGKDVYNITAPFTWQGTEYLAARVESADCEDDSEIRFFRAAPTGWVLDPQAVTLPLQDPCVTAINNQLVVGGVAVEWSSEGRAVGWKTEFWSGPDLQNLSFLTSGPPWMKDIRLVELPGGEVGVFTRPVISHPVERKPIGFIRLPSLEAITPATLAGAPILEGQFADNVWGGVNEAYLLPNGIIGVLGHVAWFDDQRHRHYWSMTFELNPSTREYSPLQLLAGRHDFPEGRAKRPDLENVIFSGGLKRHSDGQATLYAGLGDAEAGCLHLPDPFNTLDWSTPAEAARPPLQPADL